MTDIIVAFKEHLTIIKSLSTHTVDAYIRDVEDFENFLLHHKKELINSSSEELINYLKTIKNPRTQNRHLSSINSFYNFCNDNFDTTDKPQASFAKLPKKLPKYLSNEQIMKNLQLIDRTKDLGLRDYAMILFLYATGVRVSELINIKKNDIEDTLIKILYAKGSKQRVVPIASLALEALYDYINTRKMKSNYLFINYKGEPISRISVYQITKKYFNVSPHVFRHSYATSLILGGADLMVVSELLGHTNIETTQIYTHIQQKHLNETIKEFHPLNRRKI